MYLADKLSLRSVISHTSNGILAVDLSETAGWEEKNKKQKKTKQKIISIFVDLLL